MTKTTSQAPSYGMVLRPQTYGDLVQFATSAARSALVPKDYFGKPENILIAVQMGSEIGLAPMQAIQSIAVINGRPALWGDAMPGLCRGSGVVDYIKEWSEGDGDTLTWFCEAKRRDDPNPIRRSFSIADARAAGLINKPGPWTQYRSRMLMLRARGFALRDAFADVLKGLVSAEEAQDIPTGAATFTGETIEGQAEPDAPPQTRETINASVPLAEPPAAPRRTVKDWLAATLRDLDGAADLAEVEAIVTREEVQKALRTLTNGALETLREAIQRARAAMTPIAEGDGWPGPDVPAASDMEGGA